MDKLHDLALTLLEHYFKAQSPKLNSFLSEENDGGPIKDFRRIYFRRIFQKLETMY